MLPRLRSFVRRPEALLVVAFLGLSVMFFSNRDQADTPANQVRGDGKYKPVLARGDGHMMFLMTRSIVLDGDLRFDNDLHRFGDPWSQPKTKTGYTDIPHPIGPPLLWAPFFALAHGTSKVLNVFGADIPSHGYTLYHQRFTFFTSLLWAFGACVLGALVARRWMGGRWAPIYAAIAIALGTSVTYYATYMPAYGHALDAGVSGAFLGLWALTWGDLRWRRYAWLGLLLGTAALVRAQEMILGVVVAFEVVVLAYPKRRSWRDLLGLAARGALALMLALAVFGIQMIVWKIIYGDFFITPNGDNYVRYTHPQWLEVLFAPRNGWFSTTPLAYAGVVGLFFMPRRARPIQVGLLLALFLQVYLNGCILDWWGQAAYGQRRLCSMTLVLVVGLASLIAACGRAAARTRLPLRAQHALAALVLGWFVAWNVGEVNLLRGGVAAGQSAGYMPIPRWTGKMGRFLHKKIGNPFAFPASAIFALQHGVDLRRWERIVGTYIYIPNGNDLRDGRYLTTRSSWNLAGNNAEVWHISGFGKFEKEGNTSFRTNSARRATGIVPVIMPDRHRFTVAVAPHLPDQGTHVRILLNGKAYLDQDIPKGWSQLSFDADVEVGVNELTYEAEPGSLRIGSMTIGFTPQAQK